MNLCKCMYLCVYMCIYMHTHTQYKNTIIYVCVHFVCVCVCIPFTKVNMLLPILSFSSCSVVFVFYLSVSLILLIPIFKILNSILIFLCYKVFHDMDVHNFLNFLFINIQDSSRNHFSIFII